MPIYIMEESVPRKHNKAARDALADNLSRLLKSKKMSQAVLSKKSGIAQRTISNMVRTTETGSVSLSSIEAVSEALNIDAWSLLIPDMKVEHLVERLAGKITDHLPDIDDQLSVLNLIRTAENEARICEAVAAYDVGKLQVKKES